MPVYKRASVFKSTVSSTVSTVANTTVETAFTFSKPIPANSLVVGKAYKLTARGTYGTLTSGQGNLKLRLRMGATQIGATPTGGLSSSLSSRGWDFSWYVTVVSLGASGSVESQGFATLAISSNSAVTWDAPNTALVTVDTTSVLDLTLTAAFTVADPANTITLRQVVIEELG